jgi:hypothetical protein
MEHIFCLVKILTRLNIVNLGYTILIIKPRSLKMGMWILVKLFFFAQKNVIEFFNQVA